MTTNQAPVLEMTRTFEVPRDRVYRAFTDPEWFARWWGPSGTKNSDVKMDLREGGAYSLRMDLPGGEVAYLEGEYTAIEPGRRIAYTFAWRGQPMRTQVSLEFADAPTGGTTVTLRQDGFPAAEVTEQHREGWAHSFERLPRVLADA